MPKFNPHPLFPENPLYEIHSEAEIPHSDRYELWCDGRRQTVYHTDSFDYAVVVRKNSEHFPVEIHVSTAFKDVVIRPLSVGKRRMRLSGRRKYCMRTDFLLQSGLRFCARERYTIRLCMA